MTAKEAYKLEQRIKRRIASQGDRRYIIQKGGITLDLAFYRNAKEVKSLYPDYKIIRSHKMTKAEMIFFCTV